MPFPTYRQPQPGAPNTNNPAGYSPYQPSGGAQSPYFNMGYAAGKSGIVGGSSSNTTSPNSTQGPPQANVNAQSAQGTPTPAGQPNPNPQPGGNMPPPPPTTGPMLFDPTKPPPGSNPRNGPPTGPLQGTETPIPGGGNNQPTPPGYTPPQLGQRGQSGYAGQQGFEPWMYKLTAQDIPQWLQPIIQQQGLQGQQAIDRLIYFMLRNPNSDAYKQLKGKYYGVRPPGTQPRPTRNPRQMGGTTNPPAPAPPASPPPPAPDKKQVRKPGPGPR